MISQDTARTLQDNAIRRGETRAMRLNGDDLPRLRNDLKTSDLSLSLARSALAGASLKGVWGTNLIPLLEILIIKEADRQEIMTVIECVERRG